MGGGGREEGEKGWWRGEGRRGRGVVEGEEGRRRSK